MVGRMQRLLATLVGGAVGVLLASAASAEASVSCDLSSGVLEVSLDASGDVATLSVAGEEVVVTASVPLKCLGATPTVSNTNTVNVHNAPGLDFNVVGVFGADQFGPGLTSEPGDDEIEIFVNLNEGLGSALFVATSLPAGRLFFGTTGINPNGADGEDQPDRDIVHSGSVETINGAGGNGPDLISAQGGRGTGAPLTTPIVIFGGEGDDTLIGGNGPDGLFGNDGLDAIAGRGGDDEVDGGLGANASLSGGDGDDAIIPGSTSDFVDGGPGDDLLSYGSIGESLATGVSKGLEGTNAERLEGTEFADVLFGDGGSNTIVGGGGADELDGRGGPDTLDAGAGDDALQTRDGVADAADCGAGADTITADAPGIDLQVGCETSLFPGPGGGAPTPATFGARTLVTLALARARIPARGPLPVRVSNANGFPVNGTISGKSGKRISSARGKRRVRLGAASFSVAAHAATTVALALPRPLRRELARERRLPLRLTTKLRDPAGAARSVAKVLRPRLAPR